MLLSCWLHKLHNLFCFGTTAFFFPSCYAVYASRLKLSQKMCNRRHASAQDQVGTEWSLPSRAGSCSYAELHSQASSELIHTAHCSVSQGAVGNLSLLPLTFVELSSASLTSSPDLHTTWYWTSIFCVKAHTGHINTMQKPGSKEQRVLCLRIIHRAFTQ